MEKKNEIKLDDFEYNLLITSMYEFKNMLEENNLPTENIDTLLAKIIDKSER